MSEPKSSLFREEALTAHARRLDGDVIVVQPVGLRAFAGLLFCVAACALTFLSCAGYARTERVSGYLQPDSGVSTILPARAGTVTEVNVQVGDVVKAGQVLVRVASSSNLADGSVLEEDLRGALERQRTELASKQSALRESFDREQQRRQSELSLLGRKAGNLANLRGVAEERLAIATRRAESFQVLLEKGFASDTQYQDQRDQKLSLERELQQLESAAIEYAETRARLKAELDALPSTRRQQEADLSMQLLEIEARLREVEGRASYAILSPLDGKVAALQASAGGALTPGVPVAIVIPESARFEALLLVPTRASGLIRPGQSVGLKYHAFPYQEFGIQHARIRHIDTAILGSSELRAPVSVQEPVYRVSADLDSQHIVAFGGLRPLQSGMRFEADIVLETRSFLAWLLEPIYGIRGAPVASAS